MGSSFSHSSLPREMLVKQIGSSSLCLDIHSEVDGNDSNFNLVAKNNRRVISNPSNSERNGDHVHYLNSLRESKALHIWDAHRDMLPEFSVMSQSSGNTDCHVSSHSSCTALHLGSTFIRAACTSSRSTSSWYTRAIWVDMQSRYTSVRTLVPILRHCLRRDLW